MFWVWFLAMACPVEVLIRLVWALYNIRDIWAFGHLAMA